MPPWWQLHWCYVWLFHQKLLLFKKWSTVREGPRYRLHWHVQPFPVPWESRLMKLIATREDRGRNYKDKRECIEQSLDTSWQVTWRTCKLCMSKTHLSPPSQKKNKTLMASVTWGSRSLAIWATQFHPSPFKLYKPHFSWGLQALLSPSLPQVSIIPRDSLEALPGNYWNFLWWDPISPI
jgi:hypothetical protein